MDEILTDLSLPALITAVKANLYAFFRLLARGRQTEFYHDLHLMRWRTAVPYPWFNGVLSLHPPFSEAALQETPLSEAPLSIEDIIAYFCSHQIETFTWWLAPYLKRSDWEASLLAHGFRLDNHTPGMAVALDALDEDTQSIPGLEILPVNDLDMLKAWVHIFVLGYELPLSWEAAMLNLMIDLGLDWPLRNYLGCLDGEPVATSNLFLASGVAGVQCIATLPAARRRGLGSALTLAPLFDARQIGYQAGVLQSSEMGVKIYGRLGFREVCRMEHYNWHCSPDFT